VPVRCFLLTGQLNEVNVSTFAAVVTALAGSNAEHLAAGWQLHGWCRLPTGPTPSMQEVLLAHEPTFLHWLPAALGHAAMLATNSHRANSMNSRAAQRCWLWAGIVVLDSPMGGGWIAAYFSGPVSPGVLPSSWPIEATLGQYWISQDVNSRIQAAGW
jgi:hypothetical protein